MVEFEKPRFDVAAFLASAGLGRRIIQFAPKEAFFSQGDPADSIFYLQNGRAKVTVVSASGKEATALVSFCADNASRDRMRPLVSVRSLDDSSIKLS